MNKIVWLHPYELQQGFKLMVENQIRSLGINASDLFFASLTKGCTKIGAKKKIVVDRDIHKKAAFEKELEAKKPTFIIINDIAALYYITGKYESLALCRGSIYYWRGIPCLVVDRLLKTKSTKEGQWIFKSDMRKMARWISGKQYQEPQFSHTVCKTAAHLQEFSAFAGQSLLIALDIETTRGLYITTIGYTCIRLDGAVHTYVVPFINGAKVTGAHWDNAEDEIAAWNIVANVHANSALKVMQNGLYDSSFFLRYNIPLTHYLGDTLHMFHSIWTEAPKRLDFISSMCCDYYTYWKDAKNVDDDSLEKKAAEKGIAVPTTTSGMEQYWVYNALDCHNTALNIIYLLRLFAQLEWVRNNYRTEFAEQIGPIMTMTMNGIFINQKVQQVLNLSLIHESEEALQILRIMVDDPDFNPNSTPQVADLIYDVLKAKPMKAGDRTTDEKFLKLTATQNPLFARIINQIWATKKPLNNASKYGTMRLFHGRYIYQLSTAGTETGRLASKGHPFWYGMNVQNWPSEMKVMWQADPGYVFVEIDYSASDNWFTAFETEDPLLMKNMSSGKDVHCLHGEFFFRRAYDDLVAGKKAGADWVVHPIKGIRQNTKRIVYGANYLMMARTLYITMGRESVVASAEALGYYDADDWSERQLIALCEVWLTRYHTELYPGIRKWIDRAQAQAVANGNKASCAFGRTRIFFGSLATDEAIKRELAAYYGQGGSAGNINHSILEIYYKSGLEEEDVTMIAQIHDSLWFRIPIAWIPNIPRLQRLMENEVTLHGRKFVVPTEAKIGIGGGKRMIDYKPGKTTITDVLEHEKKWWGKFNAKYEKYLKMVS